MAVVSSSNICAGIGSDVGLASLRHSSSNCSSPSSTVGHYCNSNNNSSLSCNESKCNSSHCSYTNGGSTNGSNSDSSSHFCNSISSTSCNNSSSCTSNTNGGSCSIKNGGENSHGGYSSGGCSGSMSASTVTSTCTSTASGGAGGALVGGKVCRDFLRKVCRRGSRCKFVHVEGGGDDGGDSSPSSHSGGGGGAGTQQGCGTAVSATQGNTQLTFCHDYQNSHCSRNCCKFIHCTCDEENQYLQTGHIPPHVLDQAIRKGQMADVTLNGDIPICKDFLMGECEKRRGGKCKFRHLTQTEYHQEIYGYSTLTPPPQSSPPFRHHHHHLVPPPPHGDGAEHPMRVDRGRRVDMERGGPLIYDPTINGNEVLPGSIAALHHLPPPTGIMGNVMGPPDAKRPRLDPSVGVPGMVYHDFGLQQQQLQQQQQHDFGVDRDYAPACLVGDGDIARDMMLAAVASRDMAMLRGDYRDREPPLQHRAPLHEWERRSLEMTVIQKQMDNMKKEISSLKKENSDLRATNDFLLDKVTTIGASKMANGHVSTSTTLPPSVSLAQTLAAASSMPALSAAAAQVTPVSLPLTIGAPMSMSISQSISAHPTIAAPPSIAPPSIGQPTAECTVQTAVQQHSLTNPLAITSISTDGSVGSVVAIAAPPPPQAPPPSQQQPPPPPPSQQTLVAPPPPPQAVAVATATAPPTAAVVVSVGTVAVPLSQAAITITSGTLNPRITTTSMSMTLPSIATAPSIGQAIGATPGPAMAAAANIAQAISMSQSAQAISMSQGASTISLNAPPISMTAPCISLTAPPISMAAPPTALTVPPISMAGPPISMSAPQTIAISGPHSQPMSISGAAAGQLLSYPIMSQPTLRTQLH